MNVCVCLRVLCECITETITVFGESNESTYLSCNELVFPSAMVDLVACNIVKVGVECVVILLWTWEVIFLPEASPKDP